MKISRYAFLAVVFTLAMCAYPQSKTPKLAELFVYSNSVSADGVWRPDDLNDKNELDYDSVTHMECHKHGGRDLVDTEAYCAQMTASVVLGMPDIDVAYYPVIAWDSEKVIAADSSTAPYPICIWTQITVNLKDQSVMATDTRKLGKGHEGVNGACEKEVPLVRTYHLVEKQDEFSRRRSRTHEEKKN